MQFTRSWDVALSLSPCHSSHHTSITGDVHARKWVSERHATCVSMHRHRIRNWIERINIMRGINLVPSPSRYFQIAKNGESFCWRCYSLVNAQYSNSAGFDMHSAACRPVDNRRNMLVGRWWFSDMLMNFSLLLFVYSHSRHPRDRQWRTKREKNWFHVHVMSAGAELHVECVVKIDFDFLLFSQRAAHSTRRDSTKDLFLIWIENKFVRHHTTWWLCEIQMGKKTWHGTTQRKNTFRKHFVRKSMETVWACSEGLFPELWSCSR